MSEKPGTLKLFSKPSPVQKTASHEVHYSHSFIVRDASISLHSVRDGCHNY
jgi:hypothetical protein